jgi:hypothetical protein
MLASRGRKANQGIVEGPFRLPVGLEDRRFACPTIEPLASAPPIAPKQRDGGSAREIADHTAIARLWDRGYNICPIAVRSVVAGKLLRRIRFPAIRQKASQRIPKTIAASTSVK